jgi:phenylacetate-CoA ligase
MKNLLLNSGLKLLGKDVFREYKNLREIEYDSLENNLLLQNKKLKKILLHSFRNVPYYSRIFRKINLVKNNHVDLKNFNEIPILTKEIIRNNFEKLKSRDVKYNSRKPYLNTSGGSTGEPVKFIQDKDTWTKGMAGKWLFYSFITNKYPCKQIKLWGSERDVLIGGYGFKGILKNWIYKRKYLNSFKMSPRNMRKYVEEINSYKPVIIEAYVQSIYELSRYIQENKLEVYSPQGVITSAGTLYPEMKKLIKEVFGCKVFNRYGSREVGDMACSCEKDEGLHINIFSHYFEILNDKMKPCKTGEFGKVYVTTLDNYSMPLIRYDIGDIAVSSDKVCSCGRGLPLIASVMGRDVNLFKTKKEELIDGEFFTHLFYHKSWVNKFQVIQKDYDLIHIEIVGDECSYEQKSIEKQIKVVMGNDCKIKWEFTNEIEPTKSGKYLYTISEI